MVIINIDMNEESSFKPLTPGWYKAVPISFEEKISQAQNKYLQIIFEIISQQGKGRKIRDNFNLWHPDPETRTGGIDRFKLVAEAYGAQGIVKNTDVFLRKPIGIRLYITDWNERKINNIAEYCPASQITKRDGNIADTVTDTSAPTSASSDIDDRVPF